MRVLLGAALVAGAFAEHHQEWKCTDTTNCAACKEDFDECGGTNLAAPSGASTDAAVVANCLLKLNDIQAEAQKEGAKNEANCKAWTGVYKAAVEPAQAVYTPVSAAACNKADGTAAPGGDATNATTCEVAPTFTAAEDAKCEDGNGDAVVAADETACTNGGNTYTAAQDATCTLGGPTTSEADCIAAVPTFVAAVTEASCNNAGDEEPADQTACEALKDAGSPATCTLATYDATKDAGTFKEGCDAEKAGTCVASCALADKPKAGSAGSSADDGSAASPAAMIATGMAFLALFL